MSDPIPYPTAPRAALDINPQLLVLYGQAKVGKTHAVADLPGCLVLVLRQGSADHLAGNIMDIPAMAEKGAFGAFPAKQDELTRKRFVCDAYLRVLEDLTQRGAAGERVADYVAHDDLSILEDWVFDLALRDFRTTLIGKSDKFADLKSVTDLPGQGNKGSPGWRLVWTEFDRILWRIRNASPKSIILAHMREQQIDKEKGEVSPADIDLAGRMRQIILREASATGHMFRKSLDSSLVVNFACSQMSNVGSWCRHLVGKEVTLGVVKDGRTVHDWNAIYAPKEAIP